MNQNRNRPDPPKWPGKLLKWFCAPHLLEEVLGDLHERYYLRANYDLKRSYYKVFSYGLIY